MAGLRHIALYCVLSTRYLVLCPHSAFRTRHSALLCLSVPLCLCVSLLCSLASAADRPNILLIVSDDQGWPDLGCSGLKAIQTPHLDRLAREGVRLTNYYVTWPACTPSRGSILTGRYPLRNGLYDMVRNDLVNYGHRYTEHEYATSPEMTLGLDPREVTLGNVLQAAGYRCGVVGKWDMGQARRYLPLQRGFKFFYGIGNNGIDYYTHERYGIHSLFAGNAKSKTDQGTYATDLFKREALTFIRSESGPLAPRVGKSGEESPVSSSTRAAPWFLYLCFNAPHGASSYGDTEKNPKAKAGVQAPDAYVAKYAEAKLPDNLKRYYAAVTCMDDAIDEILALIEKQGQRDNTLVIFQSDNGGSGNGGNAPLRGNKSTLWEGGLRVPFIARWPGKIPAGKVSDEFLTTLELMPTLAAAAGAKLPAGVTLDGYDMVPTLAGRAPSPRTEMFWEFRGQKAARVGNYKWLDSDASRGLYDMSSDIGEKTDLSSKLPEKSASIAAKWSTWRKQMDDAEPRGPFRDY
jgi:arylsulfatase A-like enzyme